MTKEQAGCFKKKQCKQFGRYNKQNMINWDALIIIVSLDRYEGNDYL